MGFPNIQASQVALVRVDPLTGIILNDQFEHHNRSNKEDIVYTVFESFAKAMVYAEKLMKMRTIYELVIYDCKEDVLFHKSNF